MKNSQDQQDQSSPSQQVSLGAKPGIMLHSLCDHKRRGRPGFSPTFVRRRWARITKVMGFMLGRCCHFLSLAWTEVFSEIASKPSVICVCSGTEKNITLCWLVNTGCNRVQEYDFPNNVWKLYRCEGLRCCGGDLSRCWPLHSAPSLADLYPLKKMEKLQY